MPTGGRSIQDGGMKATHKLALLVGAVAGTVTVMRELRRIRRHREIVDDLPTLLPVSDAEPASEEPLRSGQIHVAQNAPL
jgi:hypothetical protein